MNRLILYDTCNFRDYPVGGQLTSIRNFLRYLAESHPECCENVLLAGVSCEPDEVGKIRKISTASGIFSFLAVTHAEADLGNVKKSLRLEYVKGLWKYRKLIGLKKEDCNYIHTPEAFAAVRLMRPGAVCYVFSHGTYLNMWQRVRFFRKAPLIRLMFQQFLMQVIRKSTAVFVLDGGTQRDYSAYNRRVILVRNSIVCRSRQERSFPGGFPGSLPGAGPSEENAGKKGKETAETGTSAPEVRFLFVGRLSGGKRIDTIIEAVKGYHRACILNILGDGEERKRLEEAARGSDRIRLLGAVGPDEVERFMRSSDILVMNSDSEGMPMVILEAISTGMPVITTDVGGIHEALTFGSDSEATDGTAQGIRKAADRILADYGRYSKMAYEKSLQFDYRKVNKKVLNILNESLKWEIKTDNE